MCMYVYDAGKVYIHVYIISYIHMYIFTYVYIHM